MGKPQVDIQVDDVTGRWSVDGLPMILVPQHFFLNNHYAVEAVLGPEKLEEVLRPAGRRSAYFWCEEAAHHHGMSGVGVPATTCGGSPSGAGANVARVLLSPFRARAAHIVSLGPVGVEQTAPQPAPPPSGPVETARQRRKRKQHSRYI